MSNIEQLIEKYFEGSTTLEEEKQLRQFFQQSDVPNHLSRYLPLFGLLEKERSAGLSRDFDERLYQKIKPTQKKTRLRMLSYRWMVAAAASLILAVSIWWLYPQLESRSSASAVNWEQYEPDDPKEAYRITKNALMKVSMELNRGARKAASEVRSVKDFLKE